MDKLRLVGLDTYVLHVRAYREKSTLVTVLTSEQGILQLISRHSKKYPLPFWHLLSLNVNGKRGGLLTLQHAEPLQKPCLLQNQALICGLYLNEVLIKMLPPWEPAEHIFTLYQQTLNQLLTHPLAAVLRRFELELVQLLGYALPLRVEVTTQRPLQADRDYYFHWGLGPCYHRQSEQALKVPGAALLALAHQDFTTAPQQTKRFMRWVLAHCLGHRKLITRTLFACVF